jgi:sugar/nucleoside kinase (ribokinase family)
MNKYDITFIGHMAYDEVHHFGGGGGKPTPGSAVLCGAMVTAKLGVKTQAIVRMAVEDDHINQPMRDLGVDVIVIPAPVTTYSQVIHESENVDERKITLMKTAGLIKIEDIPEFESACVHLAGISDSEFDMALIDALKARGYKMSTDMQSYVRQITPVTHEIHFGDVKDKKEIVSKMDMVKFDVLEARILTGTDDLEKAAVIIESWGCPEIMITRSDGVLVRANGKNYWEKFSNNSVIGRTGRGDTTFSAYMSWRLKHDVAESTKFAAALVSIKMEKFGPFDGTLEDVLTRIKEKHS